MDCAELKHFRFLNTQNNIDFVLMYEQTVGKYFVYMLAKNYSNFLNL